jgi:hypothetical protein
VDLKKPGIYPMSKGVMLSAIIEDGPKELPMDPESIEARRAGSRYRSWFFLNHWEMIEAQQ